MAQHVEPVLRAKQKRKGVVGSGSGSPGSVLSQPSIPKPPCQTKNNLPQAAHVATNVQEKSRRIMLFCASAWRIEMQSKVCCAESELCSSQNTLSLR